MPILQEWFIAFNQDTDELLPAEPMHLYGKVFRHPDFRDGSYVSTTAVSVYRKHDNTIITKSGTRYLLGGIDPTFDRFLKRREKTVEDVFPNHWVNQCRG